MQYRAFMFRIGIGTIIKETVMILVSNDKTGSLQTIGAPLLGEASLIGRLMYWLIKFLPDKMSNKMHVY